MDQTEQTIQKITRVYNNVQEFVDAYAEWDRSYSARVFVRDNCDPVRYSWWLCCPRHLLISAEKDALENWARFYSNRYALDTSQASIFSRNWFQQLEEQTTISLPEELR